MVGERIIAVDKSWHDQNDAKCKSEGRNFVLHGHVIRFSKKQ
jgi:hypothetical protein